MGGGAVRLEQGLKPPVEVMAATEEYKEEQDVFGEWLEDRVVRDVGFEATPSELFAAHQMWQAMRGEKVWSMQAFVRELKDRGFVKGKNNRGERVWRGLKLRDVGANV